MNSNMQNENRSDMSWKDKLQDADALDDIKLADKNAAWQRLQHRIQDRPKRIKPFWYWIAAACVLAAIILPFSFSKKANFEQTVVNVPVEPASPKSINATEKSKLSSVVKNESPVAIKKTAFFATKKNRDNDGDNQLKKQVAVIDKLNGPAAPMLRNILTDSSSIKNIPLIVTALTPAKKKLKVVHVNELGEPIPELNSRTSIDDYSMIQFGIIRQQPPTNTGVNKNHNSIFSNQKSTSN